MVDYSIDSGGCIAPGIGNYSFSHLQSVRFSFTDTEINNKEIKTYNCRYHILAS